MMYWLYTGPPGVTEPAGPQWQLAGMACRGGAAAVAQQPLVVTGEDLRRLPLPAGVAHVQPGGGRTLVNVPTNVYVEAEPVVLPATVLGQGVQVRATPIRYRWSFGDGGTLDTADPGAPYPQLQTTHTYAVPGTVQLGLATTYRGEFSVGGGAWQPVVGTAVVQSAPVALTVVAARAELVDGTASSPS